MALGAQKQVKQVSVPLLLAALLALLFSDAADSRVLLTVDDFGAVGDGIANDTQAFFDAWNACCISQERPVLAVPAGKVYRIWPLQIAGPCKKKVKLMIFGTIAAPASPDEWAGSDTEKWLSFYRVEDLSVSGGGTIDGKGQGWWARSCKQNSTETCSTQTPPKAVHFEECKGVKVQGITLLNSQQFHLTITQCSDVEARFLRMIAPADSPNTGGIRLNDSTNVHIMDNLISTGGDCISMVGNCTDVRIRGISCGPGSGISIGILGQNGTSNKVEKVKLDSCFISNTANGLLIKTWVGGCGFSRKMKFESILMKNVSNPIIIDQYQCDQPTPHSNQTHLVGVEKVRFVDIKGTSATKEAITFACSHTLPCRSLELNNVNLTLEGGGKASAYCHMASGKSVGIVIPDSCLEKAYFVEQIPGSKMMGDAEEEEDTDA